MLGEKGNKRTQCAGCLPPEFILSGKKEIVHVYVHVHVHEEEGLFWGA